MTKDHAMKRETLPVGSRTLALEGVEDLGGQAVGCEVVSVTYDNISSDKRQVMNQADCFYFSGHGDHSKIQYREVLSHPTPQITGKRISM